MRATCRDFELRTGFDFAESEVHLLWKAGFIAFSGLLLEMRFGNKNYNIKFQTINAAKT